MSFERGAVTFTIFELDQALPEDLIPRFAARKAGPLDLVDGEPQFGWVTGRHLLDTAISEESAQLGGAYYLALRQAVRRIPGSLLGALCRREEQAHLRANKLEYLSGKLKRQIREETIERHLQKMPPALTGIPLVLEPHSRRLYVGATGRKQLDLLIEHFTRTVGQEPIQLTPTELLHRCFPASGSDLPGLELFGDADNSDFSVGRDFLLYLWYFCEAVGPLEHPELGQLDLMIEGPLTFAGNGDEAGSGEITLKKGASPLKSAEAKAALSVGKKLKRAKFNFTRLNQVWSGVFDADNFAFTAMKLPEGETMNEDEVFQFRVESLELFRSILIAYFGEFVSALSAERLADTRRNMRNWIERRESV